MFTGKTIIKNIMAKRGYMHRRQEDGLTVNGEYAQNLQYVFSKSVQTRAGTVIDLVYFAVDILSEKIVVGLYRENPDIESGILENVSRSLKLEKFTEQDLNKMLDKLIPPMRGESL